MTQFKPGDVILTSQPFSFVILSSHRRLVCGYCWAPLTRSLKEGVTGSVTEGVTGSVKEGVTGSVTEEVIGCESCSLVNYCSPQCREEDRVEHSQECRVLGQGNTANISDQLRLVIKIWLKIRKKDELQFLEKGEKTCKTWSGLIDHYEDLVQDSKELLEAQYRILQTHINPADLPSMEQFIRIYGKILTNSFSLRSDRYSSPEPFGTGVYLLASIFDHSCTPNCTVVFQGREISVMATEEIPEGEVSDVAFISYINTIDDTATRQVQQRAIWYFSCGCSLCANARIDQEKHSLRCGGCDKGRPVDIVNWNIQGLSCTYCGYGGTERQRKEDRRQLERYRELYRLMTEQVGGEDLISQMPYDDLCEWCAGEMEPVFSDRDVLYVQTVHYVHTVCIQKERWEAAASYAETILPAFRLYYGHSTGVVAGLLVRLAQALGELGDSARAQYFFSEADRIYRVVPGVKHPFYSQDFRPLLQQYSET